MLHAAGLRLESGLQGFTSAAPAYRQGFRQAPRLDAAGLRHPSQHSQFRAEIEPRARRGAPAQCRFEARRVGLRQKNSLPIASQCTAAPFDRRQVIGLGLEYLPQGLGQARLRRRLDPRIAQPQTQRVDACLRTQSPQARHRQRIAVAQPAHIDRCRTLEQVLRLSDVPGRARQRRAGARPSGLDQRPHLPPQIAAIETRILIHGIADTAARVRAECEQLALRHIEHRPQVPAASQGPANGHGRHALEPGSAQRLQQQRFRLVFAVMRSQQAFTGPKFRCECGIARVARGRLERRARRRSDIDGDHRQGYAQACT